MDRLSENAHRLFRQAKASLPNFCGYWERQISSVPRPATIANVRPQFRGHWQLQISSVSRHSTFVNVRPPQFRGHWQHQISSVSRPATIDNVRPRQFRGHWQHQISLVSRPATIVNVTPRQFRGHWQRSFSSTPRPAATGNVKPCQFQNTQEIKECVLIGRNRTKRANFRRSPLFQATYKKQQQQQKTNKQTKQTNKQTENKQIIKLISCRSDVLSWLKEKGTRLSFAMITIGNVGPRQFCCHCQRQTSSVPWGRAALLLLQQISAARVNNDTAMVLWTSAVCWGLFIFSRVGSLESPLKYLAVEDEE